MKRIKILIPLMIGAQLYAHDHEQIINKLYSCSRKYVMQHGNELLTIALGNHTRALQVSTIIEPGYYEFASNVSTPLTVASSNVTLDLNGYTASGGITIAAGKQNVIITNGTVDGTSAGSNAVNINSGCESIKLQNLAVRNATGAGIYCDTVRDSVIQNCDLTANSTGLALDACANIVVQNCNAIKNRITGFGMVTSTTCSFIECSALSTGDGNTVTANNTVAGFISNDGFGNLFDRCIANATQALSTTDSNSLVAGFALRGTEGCSSIIGCESGNTQTKQTGYTVPYGIVLEAQLTNLTTFTSIGPGGDQVVVSRAVNWSPDGNYLAIAAQSVDIPPVVNDLWVYAFDRSANSLINGTSVASGGDIASIPRSVNWSPDGVYLAVGASTTGDDVFVYEFDRTANSLINETSVALGGASVNANSVNWSPDGVYLAIGASSVTTNDLWVYAFDRTINRLINGSSVAPGGDTNATVFAVNWSPDGKYLAIGATTTSNDIWVYEFDRSANSLINGTSVAIGGDTTVSGLSVNWSPDGVYLAIGAQNVTTNEVWVYEFDRTANSLINGTSVAPGGDAGAIVASVNWSPDGTYLAIGGTIAGNDVWVYEFDRSSNSLINGISVAIGGDQTVNVSSVNWSPDGKYLAIGASAVDGPIFDDVWVYEVLSFPSNNVIKNNTVYCNSGGRIPSGIGISGSSIENLIINNTAYANPIDPLAVATNYANVANVFNPLFAPEPSILQNLSFTNNVSINTPPDLPLLWTTAFHKCCDIASKTELLATLIP